MPSKGSGAGRIKGSPQLITRVSSDESERVEAWCVARGITRAELVRLALNTFAPELRLSVSSDTIDTLNKSHFLMP